MHNRVLLPLFFYLHLVAPGSIILPQKRDIIIVDGLRRSLFLKKHLKQ